MQSTMQLVLFAVVAITLGHSATECQWPVLKNGVADISRKEKSVSVSFRCNRLYELIGSPMAECVNGKWDTPQPICARTGCSKPRVENGDVTTNKNGTYASVDCIDGYTLAGHQWAYCNGTQWSRPLAKCMDKASIPVSCDFEADMCGWTNFDEQDENWARSSVTNASEARGGPTHDHTTMQADGHFMLVERGKSPMNASLLSPVYPSALSKDACFQFWYLKFGDGAIDLHVYVHPDFNDSYIPDEYPIRLRGDMDVWKMGSFNLPVWDEKFLIMIMAIGGDSDKDGIAIDDVNLMRGSECLSFKGKTFRHSFCNGTLPKSKAD